MQPWKQIGRYGTVGLELVLSMGIGYWVGRWADGKLNTKFLALVGLILGVFAGFRNLMRAASLMQREADREADEEVRTRVEQEKLAAQARAFSSHEDANANANANAAVNARGSKGSDAPS